MLFIAEKPAAGGDIANEIGIIKRENGLIRCKNSIVMTWCVGHMFEQAEPDYYTPDDVERTKSGRKRWRQEDLPIIPAQNKWILLPKPKLKPQIKIIGSLLKEHNIVVHAGDGDREGQRLIDETLEVFNFSGEVKRFWTSALDSASIQKALKNLEDNKKYYHFSQAALARSRADWLIGMNLSRAYSLAANRAGVRTVLSVGRVQTPTLALVVERDLKIENFTPINYFNIIARCQHVNGEFKARWKPSLIEDQKGLDEEGRLIDSAVADNIVSKTSGQSGTIVLFEQKPGQKSQPKSWDLAKLQIAASAKHGLKADEVLEACQSLYETHKLTSYPRSDCAYLPESQFANAPAILEAVAKTDASLNSIIKKADTSIKSPTWNDKKISAHHGIIPTQQVGNVSNLNKNEKLIYDLIVHAYLAQFFPPQKFLKTSIDLEISGENFSARGRVVVDPGWTVVYSEEEDEDEKQTNEKEENQALPSMTKNDQVQCDSSEKKALKTKPPKRFTDGTLIQAMVNIHKFVEDPKLKKLLKEDDGIGTPATRDSIIAELKNKGFITEGKDEDGEDAFISTPLGRDLISHVNATIKNPAMTAMFERFFKEIEAGNISANDFIKEQEQVVIKEVERLSTMALKVSAPETSKSASKSNAKISDKHKCPDCGKPLARRPGKKKGNYWWGCTGFPECKKTFWDKEGEPVAPPPKN